MNRPSDDRRKGRTGYPEPNVDREDTGIITPGGAYRGDGSVRDPRTPTSERVRGGSPVGERGSDEPKKPAISAIEHEDALARVHGREAVGRERDRARRDREE